MPVFESREYKIFKEDDRLRGVPVTLYEKACVKANKILPASPGKKAEDKLKEAIEFCHLNITPSQSYSFTILFLIFTVIPVTVLTFANIAGISLLPFGYGILLLLLLVPIVYYVYTYPMHLKLKYEMEVGSDIVSLIIYISIYMRNIPNLENAVKFASTHSRGPIAFEMRKLLWDVETGRYTNVQEALLGYSKKWHKNREFVEAVEMIMDSIDQQTSQRIIMLDESVNIIL